MKSIGANLSATIVALSTPAGPSLRAIVRVSGPQAIAIASRCVALPDTDIAALPRYGAAEGRFLLGPEENSAPITLLLMRSPSSYTREDVVEIQTFGSPVLLEMMVERLIELGARSAEPGEFTRRAFLNGRIDLAQAEAVCELIRARSEAAQRRAIEQLTGSRSHALHTLRGRLLDLCARVEAGIDFSDQDIEIIAQAEALDAVHRARGECEALLRAAREATGPGGIPVALFGRPNVGKSSLMNALVGSARSIVTHVPGTTRDVLEATVDLEGTMFRVIDTAGIRESLDALEAEGVRRARQALRSAEIGLFLLDASCALTYEDLVAWQDVSIPTCVIVLNKCDQPVAVSEAEVTDVFGDLPVRRLSCATGEGIEGLKGELVALAAAGRADASAHAFEPGLRQREVLRRLIGALQRSEDELGAGASAEIIAFELRQALEIAGELTGETVSEDILDRIFSEFCIGK